jgi:drug/metabolite transporter (DMT)-like permease
MVSGSCIVFTAVLSVLILKRRLTRLHAIGVVLSLVGVLIVSVSSLLPVEDPAKESVAKAQPMWLTVFGIVITLISQVHVHCPPTAPNNHSHQSLPNTTC